MDINREVQKRQFIENVESVKGFIVDGQENTSVEAFYECAPAELIYEIIAALENSAKLSEGQRKN